MRHRTFERPQLNSIAERINKTLLETARSMITQAKLSKRFWVEPLVRAYYLVNRSTHVALNFKSPQEVWHNLPIDYFNLKLFGCPAYIHVSKGKRKAGAKKCIFMGCCLGVKGNRIWCGKSKKIITSRDVVFDEHALNTSTVKGSLT